MIHPTRRNRHSALTLSLRQGALCLLRLFGVVGFGSSTLIGQTIPTQATGKEEVIFLSPFSVTAAQNAGYQSTVVLGGAGLRTALEDVASAVSIITPKFIEDTASRDLRDSLVYQAGIEVGGAGGNYAGGTTERSLGNTISTRVRGLASAELARGFFRALVPNDSYNTQRVDINRGANALLFGVGSPAGIINYSTLEANTARDRRKVSVAADNFGSLRLTADINQVLHKDVAGIRIALLDDNHQYKQSPAYNRDKRIYGSLVTKIPQLERGILSGTTVKLSGENGQIRSNNPRVLPPQDHLSGWFEDTRWPEWIEAGIVAKGTNNAAAPFVGAASTDGRGVAVARDINRGPVAIFPDLKNNAPADVNGSYNGQPILGRPWVTNNFAFPGSGLVGTGVNMASARLDESIQKLVGGYPDAEFFRTTTLSDPGIFDFYNLMLDGPNKEERTDFSAFTASIEQLLFNRRAGIELAFDSQDLTESRQSMLPEATQWLAIDVNTQLWDGTPNTNFGRVMTGQPGNATYRKASMDTFRAKGFFEVDFAKDQPSWLRGLLGRHIVSGLIQREASYTDIRSGGLYSTEQFWPNGNSQDRNAPTGKIVSSLHYLTDNTFGLTSPSGLNIQGVQLYRMDLPEIVNGNGVFLSRTPGNAANANLPAQAVQYQTVDIFRADREVSGMASSARKNRRVLESQAISLQSYFFDGNIVGTAGIRKEKVSTIEIDAPVATNGENYRLVHDPAYNLDDLSARRQSFEDSPAAWSIVAKLPAQLRSKIRFLSAASLFYGDSENFDPPGRTAVNAFGEVLSPPHGRSRDYGVYLRLFDDKLSVRLTRYRTTQEGTFNGELNAILNSVISTHILAYNSVASGYNPDSNGDHFPDGYIPPPSQLLDLYQVKISNGSISSASSSALDTSDYLAEGTELELYWSPTRGAAFGANLSHQQSTRTNSGAAVRRLLFDTKVSGDLTFQQAWSTDTAKGIALAAGVPFDGVNSLAQRMRAMVSNYSKVALSDGAPATELREWSGSAFASYEIQSGLMKGVGIGAAVRYQGKSSIGLPIITYEVDGTPSDGISEPDDFRSYDVKNPIYGPTDLHVDMWASYSRKLLKDAVLMKLQLNVRNVGESDHLIPVSLQPNGNLQVSRIAQPTTYTLTTSFEF